MYKDKRLLCRGEKATGEPMNPPRGKSYTLFIFGVLWASLERQKNRIPFSLANLRSHRKGEGGRSKDSPCVPRLNPQILPGAKVLGIEVAPGRGLNHSGESYDPVFLHPCLYPTRAGWSVE